MCMKCMFRMQILNVELCGPGGASYGRFVEP